MIVVNGIGAIGHVLETACRLPLHLLHSADDRGKMIDIRLALVGLGEVPARDVTEISRGHAIIRSNCSHHKPTPSSIPVVVRRLAVWDAHKGLESLAEKLPNLFFYNLVCKRQFCHFTKRAIQHY